MRRSRTAAIPPLQTFSTACRKAFQFLWGLRQCAASDGCFADFSDEPGVRRRPLLARRLLLIEYVIKNKRQAEVMPSRPPIDVVDQLRWPSRQASHPCPQARDRG